MKQISLKDINKCATSGADFSYFMSFILFILGIFSLRGIYFIISPQGVSSAKMPEALIAFIFMSTLIFAGSILLFKYAKSRNKVSITDIIIEEDFVYDKYFKSNPASRRYTYFYYIETKLNGRISCNARLYEKILKDDAIYVVKYIADNSILTTYKKSETIFTDELMQVVKVYDNNYIDNKFGQIIDERVKQIDLINCHNCNKVFKYNMNNGICPHCNSKMELKLEDIVVENNWYNGLQK